MVRRFPIANPSFTFLPSVSDTTTSPLVLTETTTKTEVVTTTTRTTTHLFPLPPWKKRGNSTDNAIVRPRTLSSPLQVEKDLPPTPADDLDPSSINPARPNEHNNRRGRIEIPFNAKAGPQSAFPSSSRKFSSPELTLPRSQTALANAALGLGLTHIMPLASAPTPSSQVFVASPPPLSRRSIADLRRSKSSQKLKVDSSFERHPGIDEATLEARRTRGISLGAGFIHEPKGKEKEKAPDPSIPSPKLLSRRPSFWSRKKTAPTIDTSLSTSQKGPDTSPLTSLDAGTRSDVEFRASRSLERRSVTQHDRELSRSHSERSRSRKARTSNPSTAS